MTDISNEPNSISLVIVQGSKLSFTIAIADASKDFTGYTGRGKIVNNFAALTVVATLTVTVNSAAAGVWNATVTLTAVETAAITNLTNGERRQPIGQYDIEVLSGTDIVRYLQGSVLLSREATV